MYSVLFHGHTPHRDPSCSHLILNHHLHGNDDVARARPTRPARPRGGHIGALRVGGRCLLGGGRGVARCVPVARLDLTALVVPVAVLLDDLTRHPRRFKLGGSAGDLARTPHRPARLHLHPRRTPHAPRVSESLLGPRRVARQHHRPFLGDFLAALARGNIFDEVDDDRSSGEEAAFKDPQCDEGQELVRDGVAAKHNEQNVDHVKLGGGGKGGEVGEGGKKRTGLFSIVL